MNPKKTFELTIDEYLNLKGIKKSEFYSFPEAALATCNRLGLKITPELQEQVSKLKQEKKKSLDLDNLVKKQITEIKNIVKKNEKKPIYEKKIETIENQDGKLEVIELKKDGKLEVIELKKNDKNTEEPIF